MPSDMRDELVEFAVRTSEHSLSPGKVEAVIDSIPSGSFKLDEKTWVRLEKVFRHSVRCELKLTTGETEGCTCDTTVYTEVDHAE